MFNVGLTLYCTFISYFNSTTECKTEYALRRLMKLAEDVDIDCLINIANEKKYDKKCSQFCCIAMIISEDINVSKRKQIVIDIRRSAILPLLVFIESIRFNGYLL